MVRFGESRGFERNEIIDNAWPFRDYVIRSFNEDKPFDVLVREHLAGDVIGKDQPGVEVGVTFLVGGPYDDVGNQDAAQAAQIRANTIDEMIRATAEAFLGLTVGCARCHDHKFDPVLQRDYYGLYATFAGVYHGSRVVATAEQRQARDETLQPLNREPRPADETTGRTGQPRSTSALSKRAAELEPQLDASAGPPHGNGREVSPRSQAKFVRLVVEGAESNPSARAATASMNSRCGRPATSPATSPWPPPAAKQRGRAAWRTTLTTAYSANSDDRRQVRRTLARRRTRVDDHAGGTRNGSTASCSPATATAMPDAFGGRRLSASTASKSRWTASNGRTSPIPTTASRVGPAHRRKRLDRRRDPARNTGSGRRI